MEYILDNFWAMFYWLGFGVGFIWSAISDKTIENYDPFTNIFTWFMVGLMSWLGVFYSLIYNYHDYKNKGNKWD